MQQEQEQSVPIPSLEPGLGTGRGHLLEANLQTCAWEDISDVNHNNGPREAPLDKARDAPKN